VQEQLVAALEQVERHGLAHIAEADETDLHSDFSFIARDFPDDPRSWARRCSSKGRPSTAMRAGTDAKRLGAP
jgi:hypothetical protein